MNFGNFLWNLLGLALPLLAAALCLPRLIALMAPGDFGFLMLAWAVVGTSSMLDLGIGRAATYYIARHRQDPADGPGPGVAALLASARATAWRTGLWGLLVFALVAGLAPMFYAPLRRLPAPDLYPALLMVGVCLPLQTLIGTYRGVGEAFLEFRAISLVRLWLGLTNFGLPLLFGYLWNNLPWIVASLPLSRGVGLLLYRHVARRLVPGAPRTLARRELGRLLLGFGGWAIVSGVTNPILALLDRLLAARAVGLARVPFYAVPYEMVAQSLVVVGAVTTIAFPYVSAQGARAGRGFLRLTVALSVFMLGVGAVFLVGGEWLLRAWLGATYRADYLASLRLLAWGLVPYTVGTLSLSWAHATGRVRDSGVVDAALFVPSALLSLWLIGRFGLAGAALSWVARATAGAGLQALVATRAPGRPGPAAPREP